MYTDNTLTPKEAIRLCALGSLTVQPMRYGDLAGAVRHFVSRVIGPTPEIMGHSIELLKYEGLVEAVRGSGDSALLQITAAGLDEVRALLTANLRPSNTELNTLIVALKFRFLHLLELEDRLAQADLLHGACERELNRLADLRENHASDAGYLGAWLDQHITTLQTRLAWLADFRERLAANG